MLVLKKSEKDENGNETRSIRFCNDYRRLNSITYKDSFPLPHIDASLDLLSGNKIFSTLDLQASYWQSEIHPEDRPKTAFVTRKGLFQYKVLAFGLTNAPAQFMRLMSLLLAGVMWHTCLVYVDDVIVMARSVEEMAERLEEILGRFRKANLKLKPTKCRLFQTRVLFLGHCVDETGISPDVSKIQAVLDWPVPRTLTEVRAFVALSAYYRKFQPNFSEMAAPLYELTRKGEPFVWDERRQNAFDRMKRALVSPPILSLPRDEGEWLVDVDCSQVASGAVLQQKQDGEWRVIAYSSRLLSKSEKNYCTTRKELLAVIHALKAWKTYLLGRTVTIRSDHSALMYLRRSPELIGQQARWLDFLENFDLVLQHRSGRAHGNADGLSRRPCAQAGPCKQCRTDRENLRQGEIETDCVKTCPAARSAVSGMQQRAVTTRGRAKRKQPQQQHTAENSPRAPGGDVPARPTGQPNTTTDCSSGDGLAAGPAVPSASTDAQGDWSIDKLAGMQAADSDLAPIVEWLKSGREKPGVQELKPYSPATKAYCAQWNNLKLANDVIYRQYFEENDNVERSQFLVPRKMRDALLQEIHANVAGHLNVSKTQQHVQKRAYWYGWRKDVEVFCRACVPCNQYFRGMTPRQGRLQDMRTGAPPPQWSVCTLTWLVPFHAPSPLA